MFKNIYKKLRLELYKDQPRNRIKNKIQNVGEFKSKSL